MADGKRSFLLYADLLFTIEKLPDEKAGALFKHILEYVNDKDPKTDDMIVDIAFEPIKRQLKRDLNNWESIRKKRSFIFSFSFMHIIHIHFSPLLLLQPEPVSHPEFSSKHHKIPRTMGNLFIKPVLARDRGKERIHSLLPEQP